MRRYRTLVLGSSFGRLVQAVGFQRHPGFELTGIAGSDPEKSLKVAEELGVRGSHDWRQLLRDLEPELVSVATPVDLHYPMTVAALEAGAHVLCEKPTALNRFQAADMRDRAAAAGRRGFLNHEFRWFPARRLAIEQLHAGAIGVPRRGEILGRYPIWPRPESRGMTWLSSAARGGGILGALGSHHTDCLRTFFGEPSEVLASVRVEQPRRGSAIATADDSCTMRYRFDNGAVGVIDLCAAMPYRWERFEIHGSEATLRWDETGYRLWRIVAGAEPEELGIPETLALDRHPGEPALVAPFVRQLDALHVALEGGATTLATFDDGVAVQSALDAVRSSSDARAEVAIAIPAPGAPA